MMREITIEKAFELLNSEDFKVLDLYNKLDLVDRVLVFPISENSYNMNQYGIELEDDKKKYSESRYCLILDSDCNKAQLGLCKVRNYVDLIDITELNTVLKLDTPHIIGYLAYIIERSNIVLKLKN